MNRRDPTVQNYSLSQRHAIRRREPRNHLARTIPQPHYYGCLASSGTPAASSDNDSLGSMILSTSGKLTRQNHIQNYTSVKMTKSCTQSSTGVERKEIGH